MSLNSIESISWEFNQYTLNMLQFHFLQNTCIVEIQDHKAKDHAQNDGMQIWFEINVQFGISYVGWCFLEATYLRSLAWNAKGGGILKMKLILTFTTCKTEHCFNKYSAWTIGMRSHPHLCNVLHSQLHHVHIVLCLAEPYPSQLYRNLTKYAISVTSKSATWCRTLCSALKLFAPEWGKTT